MQVWCWVLVAVTALCAYMHASHVGAVLIHACVCDRWGCVGGVPG